MMSGRLKVKCTRDENAPKGAEAPYINELVKSGDFEWRPQGIQTIAVGQAEPGPTNKVLGSLFGLYGMSCG